MKRLKLHVWSGRPPREFCEACGCDKPKDPKLAAKRDCSPTQDGPLGDLLRF